MEHIETKNSLDSKLQTVSLCSIRILNILEVIAKNKIFKRRKMLNSVSFHIKLTFNSAIGRDKQILAFDVSMDKSVLV